MQRPRDRRLPIWRFAEWPQSYPRREAKTHKATGYDYKYLFATEHTFKTPKNPQIPS